MKRVLVVAPHADDETLGCGGTLLKHIANGDMVYWLISTNVSEAFGYTNKRVSTRSQEIADVFAEFGFSGFKVLNFKPAALDSYPIGDIIQEISAVVDEFKPEIIYAPYRSDAHSDHAIIFDAVMASSKSFRYPCVKRTLLYETISETDYNLKPDAREFRPNVFVDIDGFLDSKLKILSIFESEMGEFPFPRSKKAISSLAYLRGSQCNAQAAEAFMLMKEII